MKIHCEYTELVKWDELKPHALNPNTHDEDQIRKLAKMIQYHGWRMPVTVSKRSGFVVRGHGRLLAAEFAGIEDIPVDYQDYDTEDQELADLMADNKIAESSCLDDELTDDILASLGDDGFDIELTGFDIADYEKSSETGDQIDTGGQTKDSGLTTALPYVFPKEERDYIMRVLKENVQRLDVEGPGRVLVMICGIDSLTS